MNERLTFQFILKKKDIYWMCTCFFFFVFFFEHQDTYYILALFLSRKIKTLTA